MLSSRLRGYAAHARRRGSLATAVATARFGRADLAVFHQLEPPPAGGGHQFIRALIAELERRGRRVERNRLSAGTPACLFNSFNFDFERLRRLARDDCRLVHRVDGPIGAYRGHDDGSDARLAALNAELADATIFQSRYSAEEHARRGLELVAPVVISNAPDPRIFFPPPERAPVDGRPLRLIAASWSDNPRKGGATLEWLDAHARELGIAVTFVGRTQARLRTSALVPAVPSLELAELFRSHDAYLAPSLNEACSNALLEALACGLPAVYARSGGNPELVGEGGLGYASEEELHDALRRLPALLETLRARIRVTPLTEVADRYLEVLDG